MRGLSEANGSWNTICIERRCGPHFGLADADDIGAVQLDGAAGRLHQPKHATRDRRFAAAGFADPARAFRLLPTEKLTPSTACTVPTRRRSTPPRYPRNA